MSKEQPNYPLHGVTLSEILDDLVDRYGFEQLSTKIRIRCFEVDPSISSSLRFLRKHDWARKKVEALYLADHPELQRN